MMFLHVVGETHIVYVKSIVLSHAKVLSAHCWVWKINKGSEKSSENLNSH